MMVANGKQTPKNKCPICKTPVGSDVKTFPFCSDRCKQIDLGKWLDGKYTISRPIDQSDLEAGD